MSEPLTLVASIQALPGHESAIEQALQDLVEPTRTETGCLQYDLHRDLETPGLFHFYEAWATRADWETHNDSAHIAGLLRDTQGMMARPVIYQMERISS